jgi:hypothetical protein
VILPIDIFLPRNLDGALGNSETDTVPLKDRILGLARAGKTLVNNFTICYLVRGGG